MKQSWIRHCLTRSRHSWPKTAKPIGETAEDVRGDLTGKIFDDRGNTMSPTYSREGRTALPLLCKPGLHARAQRRDGHSPSRSCSRSRNQSHRSVARCRTGNSDGTRGPGSPEYGQPGAESSVGISSLSYRSRSRTGRLIADTHSMVAQADKGQAHDHPAPSDPSKDQRPIRSEQGIGYCGQWPEAVSG